MINNKNNTNETENTYTKNIDTNTCCWYHNLTNSCNILECLQCQERGKCTFYETIESKEERCKKFDKIMYRYERRLKEISEKKKWNKGTYRDEWNDLLKLSAEEKEEYLSNYERQLKIDIYLIDIDDRVIERLDE